MTDRRQFLEVVGLGATALAAGCGRGSGEATGPRLAMAIDIGACERHPGCRDCIDACHAVHNVPAFREPAHRIEWLGKEPFAAVFPEEVHELMTEERRESPVLVLCNHCGSPPCTRVCPTGATWKRDDGIIMMDEHRCIGCRYCMAACPYGARSFNWRDPREGLPRVDPGYPTRTTGVVEKCTFCAERLREGQRPACVEAATKRGCGAILWGDLDEPEGPLAQALRSRNVIRRRPSLGTDPHVFYLL